MECDGRGCAAWRAVRTRTAKAGGPDTPGLVLSLRKTISQATVTNKVMGTGASTQEPVNTIAQGMSVQRLTCSDYASVLSFCTLGYGCG